MIVDDIKNIENYSIIPAKAVDFIKSLTSETPVGHYEIDEKIYVNVDIYNTKSIDDCKFEAHKKYIDIQMLLQGQEEIDILPADTLIVSEKYDDNRDVMFFGNSDKIPDKIQLEAFKFVYILPSEAHKPQIGNGQKVKKVVAKIAV